MSKKAKSTILKPIKYVECEVCKFNYIQGNDGCPKCKLKFKQDDKK
jgi:hypothetical protein